MCKKIFALAFALVLPLLFLTNIHLAEASYPEMTHAEKIALPIETAIGTRVIVTDAFELSGMSNDMESMNGYWYEFEADVYSSYAHIDHEEGVEWIIERDNDTGKWIISNDFGSLTSVDAGDAYPWRVTEWEDSGGNGSPEFNNPPIQELQAPDTWQTLDINATDPSELVMFMQHFTAEVNTNFALSVGFLDYLANVNINDAPVTLSLADNEEGATLSGTLTQSAINITVRYDDLSINKPGTYRIVATSEGLTSTSSPVFTITRDSSRSRGGGSSRCQPGFIYTFNNGPICTLVSAQAPSFPSTNSTSTSIFNFARDLTLGAEGEDVRQLQMYLNSHGYFVSQTDIGSPGKESLYFGQLTRSALARFQQAKGITPSVGYFGQITRGFLNVR
jgi:hypothetical protein